MTGQAQYETIRTTWYDKWKRLIVGGLTPLSPRAAPSQSAAALPGNLKRLMAERGWDVRRLSREAEVSVSTIRGILNGIYPTSVADPLLSTCLKLAYALHVGVEELVREA
jgi:lambda repressor-like predicted transcriptional regulator